VHAETKDRKVFLWTVRIGHRSSVWTHKLRESPLMEASFNQVHRDRVDARQKLVAGYRPKVRVRETGKLPEAKIVSGEVSREPRAQSSYVLRVDAQRPQSELSATRGVHRPICAIGHAQDETTSPASKGAAVGRRSVTAGGVALSRP